MMTNQNNNQRPAGSLTTRWALRTYDVWGNAKDGWDVNDTFSVGEVELRIPQTLFNADLPAAKLEPERFTSAYPTDRQIKRAFGVSCRIETDGDDISFTVTRQRDGFPIGEMFCLSHESLSPVRAKAEVTK